MKRKVSGMRYSVGKVQSIVNRMAINKRFVINMIMFVTFFALCSSRGCANYCYISILRRAY